MMSAVGRIIAARQGRFLLEVDDGCTLLLTVGQGSHVEPGAVEAWHRAHSPVTVEFDRPPGLASNVVRSIRSTAAE